MIRHLGHLFLVVVLTVSVGGHWAVLQGVAWAAMAAQFAQTDRWEIALQKTFDGKHPCELCKAVQKGKASEKQNEIPRIKVKLELGLVESHPALPTPPKFKLALSPDSPSVTGRQQPPTPPPRPAGMPSPLVQA
jgi:hypothetical protein